MVKPISRTETVYEANDGVIFKNENRCKKYEKEGLENGIKNRDNLISAVKAKGTKWTPEFLDFIKAIPDSRARAVMSDIYHAKDLWDEETTDGYQQLEFLHLQEKDSLT